MKTSNKQFPPASFAGASSYFKVNSFRIISITTILLLALTCVGSAANLTVGSSGENFTSIQAAVNAANVSDTILVSPGTYNENVYVDKQVSIISTGGAAVTNVVAASADDHVFNVTADGVVLTGFTASGATAGNMAGIYVVSNYNTISENIASGNDFGIYLFYSDDNNLSDNIASDNVYGLFVEKSKDSTLRNNQMNNNARNFRAVGVSWGSSDISNDIDTSNTVDGKPIYYLVDVSGVTIDSSTNAGTVYALDCDDITIKDLTLTDNWHGIYLCRTTNSRVENVNSSNNRYGISLWYYTTDNVVDNNVMIGNKYGITLHHDSNNNQLTNNVLSETGTFGIQIYGHNNIVRGNTASFGDGHGFLLGGINNTYVDNTASNNDQVGFYNSGNSTYNELINNTFSNNGLDGIRFVGGSYNTFVGNTITDNEDYGINLHNASNNLIYNNLFNNKDSLEFTGTSADNQWNIAPIIGENIVGGPYIGGNYWAKPDGSGFSQTATDDNGDGFSDSVYTLDSSNVDELPLMTGAISNAAPIVTIDSITPETAVTGETVSFTGTGIDADGTIVAYEWSSNIDGSLSNSASFNINNLSPGTHAISFTALDDGGSSSAAATASITIDETPNVAPTANIVLITPSNVTQGDSVSFTGNGSDIDGTIAAYNWTSSIDGELSAEASFSTTLLSPGTHAIFFSVQDDDGARSDNVSSTLTVNEASGQNGTDSTAPVLSSVTPISGSTLAAGTTTADIRFDYSDDQSGINTSSIAFTFASVDVTGDSNTTITDSYASYNATGLTAGSYSATVLVLDNENNSASFSTSFTISEASSSSSGSSSSSSKSSSSSGGGGGSTGEKYSNILVKEVKSIYLINGAHINYEFSKDGNAISSIQFDSLKNSGSVKAIVEVLKDRSSFADSDAPGDVYQEMNIWVGKSGFVREENVEDLLITFMVEKSWLADNDIKAENVMLYRYTKDGWNELPTTVTTEDSDYVYFEADTPGFSAFAIASEVENVETTEEGELMSVADEVEVVGDEVSNEKSESLPEETSTSKAGIFIVIGGLVVLLVAGFVLYKKQS